MHKIELHGTLCISSDLASRLQARGLLSNSCKCTEDLILFIQECVAREDSRCSILADKSCLNVSLPSAVANSVNVVEDRDESESKTLFEENNVSEQVPESGTSALQNSLNSLVDESDLAALRQGLNTLYQGG